MNIRQGVTITLGEPVKGNRKYFRDHINMWPEEN